MFTLDERTGKHEALFRQNIGYLYDNDHHQIFLVKLSSITLS
jgi:hypothetical protein